MKAFTPFYRPYYGQIGRPRREKIEEKTLLLHTIAALAEMEVSVVLMETKGPLNSWLLDLGRGAYKGQGELMTRTPTR